MDDDTLKKVKKSKYVVLILAIFAVVIGIGLIGLVLVYGYFTWIGFEIVKNL